MDFNSFSPSGQPVQPDPNRFAPVPNPLIPGQQQPPPPLTPKAAATVNVLRGPTEEKMIPSNPVTQFPSKEDVAEENRLSGNTVAYGKPYEDAYQNRIVRALNDDPNFLRFAHLNTRDYKGSDLDLLEQQHPMLKDLNARTALAANNSGLTQLGFDPRHAALDYKTDPGGTNMLGQYSPRQDQLFANAGEAAAATHEYTHRGIDLLSKTKYWKPEFNEFLTPDLNELAVHHIMSTKMGDPEVLEASPMFSQINAAKAFFKNNPYYQKLLDEMDMAASQYMADKHPGGPR